MLDNIIFYCFLIATAMMGNASYIPSSCFSKTESFGSSLVSGSTNFD